MAMHSPSAPPQPRLPRLEPTDRPEGGSWIYSLFALIFANAAVLLTGAVLLPTHASAILRCYSSAFSSFDGSRLIVSLAVLTGCLLVEMQLLGWQRCALRKLLWPSRSARHDWVMWIISVSGFSVALLLFFTAGVVPILPADVRGWVGAVWVQKLDSLVLQVVISFVAHDFLAYWFHRGMHMFAFAWEAHKYHHAATEFNMLTATRSHIAENALGHIFVTLPLVILGMKGETFVAIMIVTSVISHFNHSMIDWRFGWFGRWILVSPVAHRIHHSMLPEHWDKNFSGTLLIWDRLFGTWYDGDKVNTEVGVTHNYVERETVAGGFVTCYVLFLRQFVRSLLTNEWFLSTRRQRQLAESESKSRPDASDREPVRHAA